MAVAVFTVGMTITVAEQGLKLTQYDTRDAPSIGLFDQSFDFISYQFTAFYQCLSNGNKSLTVILQEAFDGFELGLQDSLGALNQVWYVEPTSTCEGIGKGSI